MAKHGYPRKLYDGMLASTQDNGNAFEPFSVLKNGECFHAFSLLKFFKNINIGIGVRYNIDGSLFN